MRHSGSFVSMSEPHETFPYYRHDRAMEKKSVVRLNKIYTVVWTGFRMIAAMTQWSFAILRKPNLNFALVESPCVDKTQAMYKSAKERGFSFKITAALHTSPLFYLRTYWTRTKFTRRWELFTYGLSYARKTHVNCLQWKHNGKQKHYFTAEEGNTFF